MSKYVDGFVLVVPKGKAIVFESKEHRDEVNKKVMEEMGEAYKEQSDFVLPFEMNRMAYGGFEVLVEGQKA